MRFNTIGYCFKQGFKNIWRNKLFSLASMATMAACIFMFGIFFCMVQNFQHFVREAEEGVAVTVLFDEGTTEDEILEIGQGLTKRDGVSEVVYVSADEAWKSYQEKYFEGNPEDMDDILGGMFGDMFGGHGGKRRTSGARGRSSQGSGFHGGFGSRSFDGFTSGGGYQSRGQDITSDLTVTFDEAAFGCDKMITLTSSDGRKQTLQLHIPAGMEDGKSLRLQGKGGAGVNGAPAGDLLICIHVAEKPGFTRKGADVYTIANIPFTTAVLGGEAIINTLNGRVSCRIKPGTQSGSKIRLKGKGVANMRDPKTFGDLYVTVQIEVPTSLSAEALAKLREFEAASDRKKGGFHAA